MQNQTERLCNIPPDKKPIGGGTAKYQIVCEQRCDEGIRFFQDGCCGTIRTIDGGGDKRVLEQIIEVPTTKT